MKNSASFLALGFALSVAGAAQADSNYEYASQPNLAQIHVTANLHNGFYTAYIAPCAAIGATCSSQLTVAILDGLADYTHVDLTGHETDKTVYTGSYASFANHATHVSGIIGAALNGIGIVGVDPFSTLLNIPVFDDNGWVATDLGKLALDTATGAGARVVNMSYGSTMKGAVFLSGELDLFKNYNSTTPGQGMVLVRAAGNDRINIKSQAFSGNASVDLSNLLIVGSVDSNNKISYFSNKAGNGCIGSCGTNNINAVKNFYLVAPGENILSDLPNNYLGYMSGTSMATPEVAGAAALVFQRALAGNNLLTPGQVADILKKSADDLGTPGVDSTYGWGLLDVARALNPVGGTYFTTGVKATSGLVTVQSTTVTSSSIVATASLQNALSGIIVLDGYGRAFTVDVPKLSPSSAFISSDFVQGLAGTISSVTDIETDGETTLSLTGSGDPSRGGFRVASFDRRDAYFETGLVGSLSYFTTLGAAESGRSASFSRRMAEDFYAGSGDVALSLNQAFFVGTDLKTSSRWTLSGLYLRTAPLNGFSYVPDNISAVMMAQNPLTSSALKLGASYSLSPDTSVGVYSGFLGEQGQTLGMHTGGAFSLGNGSTFIGGVNFRAALSESTTISAFAEQASTLRPGAEGSIFAATGNWTSRKYGLSLTEMDPLGWGGLLQLKLVRPWQIDQGSLRLHVPVGRELDGTINYEDRLVSMAAERAPVEVGLAYLAGTGTIKYGAELTTLDHAISGNGGAEVRVAGAFHWSF